MSEVGTTADINEIASYTEYNVTTPTADFAVGFDYDEQTSTQKGDAIRVTINRVDPSTLGYTVTLTNKNTVNFSPSVPSGNVVRLQRETDIDSNLYTFSAGALFVATQVDADFKQIRKSQQEVRDRTNNTLDYVETTIANYDDRIETVELATAKNSQDIASEILRAKAGEKGLQNQINNTGNSNTVTPVKDITELDNLKTWDGRTVYVRNDGEYYYSEALGEWVKDSSFMLYDFKTEQPIQAYYDQIGNWDDAIFQAQMNVYLLGYSPRLVFPAGDIKITRPIYVGHAFGDMLHKARPDLNFYDSKTNTYKQRIDFILQGSGRGRTHITFYAKTRTDRTWMNYGIIHGGSLPDEYGAKTQRWVNWTTTVNISDMHIIGFCDDGNDHPHIHGILLQRGGSVRVSDVAVQTVYGAGILLDGIYDSWFEKFILFSCGRSSFPEWTVLRNNDPAWYNIKYSAYGALHIMNSASKFGTSANNNVWDNNNFIRFNDFHIEDCANTMVDISISGNSTPMWFRNAHFENDAYYYYSNYTNRTFLAINQGVSDFSEDGQDGYVYSDHDYSLNKTGSGGQVIWDGGSVYSPTYTSGYAIQVGAYSKLTINNGSYPNYLGSMQISPSDANTSVVCTNTEFGNINISGGNDADYTLTLNNCKATNITGNYSSALAFNNVKCSGYIKLSNTNLKETQPLIFNSVQCSYAEGVLDYAQIRGMTTVSTSDQTTMYVARGVFECTDSYVLKTLGAI